MPKSKTFSFNPKEVSKKLLADLPDRGRDVLKRRYGLGPNNKKETLESIGSAYNITRERVRQIEHGALEQVKRTEAFAKLSDVVDDLKNYFESEHGHFAHEEQFLSIVDPNNRNHVHFVMVLADVFHKIKEDDFFHHRWTTNKDKADKIHNALKKVAAQLSPDDLIKESEILESFLAALKSEKIAPPKTHAANWLKTAKSILCNPLGEWGLTSSPNIHMRGIRDYAYLVIRREGKPLHFSEVAKRIGEIFGKKAHPATCHNELIKDGRFVLVGRGLYALKEWGFTKGVVRDVIVSILKSKGPLNRDQIVKEVLKERFVKENTVVVNLQNTKHFKRDARGRYRLA